jgi:adenine specific DNA methylase Mod
MFRGSEYKQERTWGRGAWWQSPRDGKMGKINILREECGLYCSQEILNYETKGNSIN